MSLISSLADAIQRQEGFAPGTRAFRNNNPGNIWDGIGNGKTQRIWPQYPIDGDGFLVLPDPGTGRALMENQLQIKIARGETLSQLLNEWDSGDPASTRSTYVSNVASWTGLPADIPLNQIVSSQPVSGDEASTDFPSIADAIDPLGDDPSGLEDGSINWGLVAALFGALAFVWYLTDQG